MMENVQVASAEFEDHRGETLLRVTYMTFLNSFTNWVERCSDSWRQSLLEHCMGQRPLHTC